MSTAEPVGEPCDPTPVFAAVGDATRLALLRTLGEEGEQSLSALSARRRITRQAVSQHLQVLETAGLVRRTHVGRETRYTLQPGRIADATAWLQAMTALWDARLERLRRRLEA